ncbi:cold-shock protein [Streptomyces gelaticus]
MATGKVLRFDEVRGYGFIAPTEAGEDVFMHANDLIDEKYLYQEGSEVEFFLEAGDKGPKASQIRLVHQPSTNRLSGRTAGPEGSTAGRAGGPSSGRGAAPSAEQFRTELTEALLESAGTPAADQIRQVRESVVGLARARGRLAP